MHNECLDSSPNKQKTANLKTSEIYSQLLYITTNWILPPKIGLTFAKQYTMLHINRHKNRNHISISMDAEKVPGELHNTWRKKLGIDGTFLTKIKLVHDKLIANL